MEQLLDLVWPRFPFLHSAEERLGLLRSDVRKIGERTHSVRIKIDPIFVVNLTSDIFEDISDVRDLKFKIHFLDDDGYAHGGLDGDLHTDVYLGMFFPERGLFVSTDSNTSWWISSNICDWRENCVWRPAVLIPLCLFCGLIVNGPALMRIKATVRMMHRMGIFFGRIHSWWAWHWWTRFGWLDVHSDTCSVWWRRWWVPFAATGWSGRWWVYACSGISMHHQPKLTMFDASKRRIQSLIIFGLSLDDSTRYSGRVWYAWCSLRCIWTIY